ncbi:MAG: glycoside hydrolase family 3 C-terminal domain-containing protein [Bacteroidales bacterium]|nr:glycoside hydrolase family 3 C-terminal domain-containing protein [Bacteroidales bacterium]
MIVNPVNSLKAIFFAAVIMVSCAEKGGNYVEDTLKKMTLREKIDMIGGYKSFNIRAYDKYNIPEIHMADGPVGVRNYGASTAYPASINLAASWDREIARKVGEAIGMEAKNKNVHIMLGPGMNIYRGPFCGRNFEYLGEDPCLAGELASSYIIGMQEQGIVATAKHYVANYQDFDRHNVSSDMDERTLHEIYLPAFKACVQKGNVGAVMTSYNLINDIHASQHDYLINEVLKKTWGFKGIVMSDWTSTYDGVACAKAGLDLEMPSGDFMNYDTLLPAIKSGELSEAAIDDKVRRILNLYQRFGYYEKPTISDGFKLDKDYVREIALDAARGGITLLKNEGKTLPISSGKVKKIAVIGPNAHPAVTGGGGSSKVDPLHVVSLFEAVKEIAGPDVEVVFERAILQETELPKKFFRNTHFYHQTENGTVEGVKAQFYGNTNLEGDPVFEGVFDHIDHTMHDSVYAGVPDVNYSARFEACFNVDTGGNYRLALAGDDGYRLIMDGDTLIDQWHNQPETVRSIDMVLKAGKEYSIRIDYYQGGGSASIRFGYMPKLDLASESAVLWQNAVKAARESDLVIFAVGFNPNIESEGMDRSWELPKGQDEMIKKISALNSNSVVVLNAGGNVGMPWLNQVGALLYAWYPGGEGNLAVAEILFGNTNPSGKLPVSFEKRWEDNPAFGSYFDHDGDKKVYFEEGIFLGYRHYDRSAVKPLFPFGFGLSYTSFDYAALKLEKDTIRAGEPLTLSFTLTNSGAMGGAEVAQVYVRDMESELDRPVKELKNFDKLYLEPQESGEVKLTLDPGAFSYYNPEKGGWVTEPGTFEILVGASSEDILLKAALIVTE